MPNQGTILHRILRYSDIIIAVAVVTIVVMMIIPLPTFLLDMLLALNISLALVIVMVAIYNEEPLDFSVFPSLLLLATLFRLALNVSATRLILLEGYAGEDAWKAGIQAYMKAHAYGNTVTDDLWKAVEGAGAKGLVSPARLDRVLAQAWAASAPLVRKCSRKKV